MKKIVTIVVVILVVLGFGYFLFKISPQQEAVTSSGYNSAISSADVKTMPLPSAFDPATERFLGDPKAKNVFVEYSDYQCPSCAAFSEILKPLPTTFKDTVFVYRYFPLIQIHPNSVESALAAEAAGNQGKYWEMHDILFAKQNDWANLSDPLDTFAEYAITAGVANIEQFKTDITSKKNLPIIQKYYSESLGLNLPGTPSMFFNGHALKNADLAGLKQQAEALYVK